MHRSHFFIIFLLLVIILEIVLLLPKPSFVDAGETAGIKAYPFVAGVSWGDVDGDGFLDLLIAGEKTRLYHNNKNATFTDITESAQIFPGPTMMGVVGDYDNDGCKDIFFVGFNPLEKPAYSPGFGEARNYLYHNNCDGTFTDESGRAGIKKEFFHGAGAAWADYDSDGFLDLYVANYGVHLSKTEYASEQNLLYHNNGDGSFTDVTLSANVTGATNCTLAKNLIPPDKKIRGGPHKESFQPVWFDYNNDGKTDLFIATDRGISPLYKNNADGTFREVTQEAGLCKGGTGMGVAVGDYDGNGYLDLYVTNLGVNYLWQNNGNGTFSEKAPDALAADPLAIGWGTGFVDYDNHGYLDLYVANGYLPSNSYGVDPEVGKAQVDKLYKNRGDGTFAQIAKDEGVAGDFSKGSVAFGDYNNDGFTDLVVATNYFVKDGKIQLYKNHGNRHHWLTLVLQGTKSNRDAIGARITLTLGGKKQIREVISGSSFISQNSLWQTFGLGNVSVVDEIEIVWPSGKRQILQNVKSKQTLVVGEDPS